MRLIKKNAGFTIIELIITLMVSATVLAIGVPSFTSFLKNAKAVSNVNDLLASLAFARSEAIKRTKRVVLCKTIDNATCTGTDWDKGWMIFVDLNNNSLLDGDEFPLRVHGQLTGNKLSGNNDIKDYVSYASDGKARFITGGFQSGTFTFDLCTNNKKYTIVISNTGRAQIRKISCTS